MIAAALCLAGCQPAQAPAEEVQPTLASEVAAPPPAPAVLPEVVPSTAPLPPVEASDDEFVGWYFEKAGNGHLQACGQAAPLQVSDPSFLRQLKGKLGGGNHPVYVRLRVRLAGGSTLEVTEVQQFGVDETPVQDCPLVASGS